MEKVTTVEIELAKNAFRLHGVDGACGTAADNAPEMRKAAANAARIKRRFNLSL